MMRRLQLSELAAIVQETIEDRFYNDTFWITAEITDVKKYESKRWCFLKFVEKIGAHVATEMQAVFWANAYQHIILFEKITKQTFQNGIEISCRVAVRFHPRYGLKLEVQEIDTSYALGKLEQERQQTLDKLLKENPQHIRFFDDEYYTSNKALKLAVVVQRIALITAPGSDGQRDFIHELENNAYNYHFTVTPFLSQLQGNIAAVMIKERLHEIYERASDFDAVVIVRGGGSQTDLTPFDDYELARTVAAFPVPIFTGIGHDRNISIVDLMARQMKTPTKVASAIVDINLRFDADVQELANRLHDAVESLLYDKQAQLERWHEKMNFIVPRKIEAGLEKLKEWKIKMDREASRTLQLKKELLHQQKESLLKNAGRFLSIKKEKLDGSKRVLHQLSPATVLSRGFAILMQENKIISHVEKLDRSKHIKTVLLNAAVESSIVEITKDEPANI